MGLLTLFRVVCYIILVGPLSDLPVIPVNSDMFPSGYSRLALWGWPPQDYTTLSIFHPAIPSTAALNFTVLNLPPS